nr:MAG TPA: hypothetical protein [Caudoviricetes sp.]
MPRLLLLLRRLRPRLVHLHRLLRRRRGRPRRRPHGLCHSA